MKWTPALRAWSCWGALGALFCGSPQLVRAHAPEPRGVAVTSDGSGVALSLPGFGIMVRADASQPFVYVCDALLSSRLTNATHSMIYQPDGSLLVAGSFGVRRLAADGCPLAPLDGLHDASVVVVAAQPSAPQTVYAVASGASAWLWRSADGGRTWHKRAPLGSPELVTALVVSPADSDRLYLSVSAGTASLILASSDGGNSFVSHPQPTARTLLSVQGGTPERLWAHARDAQSIGNRGFAIMRAETPEGPFQTRTRVAYLGGFAIGADGSISIGDELGGVYRSSDEGTTFQHLNTQVPVASLAQAGDVLWAGTPNLLHEPALQTMTSAQHFEGVVAFSEVESWSAAAPSSRSSASVPRHFASGNATSCSRDSPQKTLGRSLRCRMRAPTCPPRQMPGSAARTRRAACTRTVRAPPGRLPSAAHYQAARSAFRWAQRGGTERRSWRSRSGGSRGAVPREGAERRHARGCGHSAGATRDSSGATFRIGEVVTGWRVSAHVSVLRSRARGRASTRTQ